MNAPIRSSIRHGGELSLASEQYARPVQQWLDLSTGVSPDAWPVPAIPPSVWQRLPDQDGLESAAAAYYRCGNVLPLAVPGSQWAIEQVPDLLPAGGVAMPAITYAEHPAAWQKAGHRLYRYRDWSELEVLLNAGECRYLVLVSPGNPCGQTLPRGALTRWRGLLGRDGLCLVDEAFQDVHDQEASDREMHECTATADRAELIRLRSVGKFFGLAGLRLGFVLADVERRALLASRLSPWSVSHPARYVGALALADRDWQSLQRQRLWRSSDRLSALLRQHLPSEDWYSAGLFVSALVPAEKAKRFYTLMAECGILLRLRDDAQTADGEAYVRVGLPAPLDWPRFIRALEQICNEC